MNQPPNQPPNRSPHADHRERQRQLQEEHEVMRLRQEQQRVKAAQRRQTLDWIRNAIILLVGALEILLAMRFFLRISLANLENTFARFIMNLSAPFVSPFSTLFISPTNADGSRIFDVNVIVAMVIYALLGALAIALVNYFQGPPPAQR